MYYLMRMFRSRSKRMEVSPSPHGSSPPEYRAQYKQTPPHPSESSPASQQQSPAQHNSYASQQQDAATADPAKRYGNSSQSQTEAKQPVSTKIEESDTKYQDSHYQQQHQHHHHQQHGQQQQELNRFQNLPSIHGLTHNRFANSPRSAQHQQQHHQHRYNHSNVDNNERYITATPMRHIVVSGYAEHVNAQSQYQDSINVKYERVEDGEKPNSGSGGGGQQQDTTYVTLETVQSMNHGGSHPGYQQMSSYSEDSPPPYNQPTPYMTYRAEASPTTEIPYTVSYAEQKDIDSPGGPSVVYMKSDPTLTTTTGGNHTKAIGYSNTVLQGHYEGHNASPTQQVPNNTCTFVSFNNNLLLLSITLDHRVLHHNCITMENS